MYAVKLGVRLVAELILNKIYIKSTLPMEFILEDNDIVYIYHHRTNYILGCS